MSDVSTKHPDYIDHEGEWRLMRDTYRGTKAIKGAGEMYLPKPTGFSVQNDGGLALYSNYKARAEYPELLPYTLTGMVGVIHRREAQIEMPPSMRYLWEHATLTDLTLEALHRRITSELLQVGRYVLMADAPPQGGSPFISSYVTENLINWDEKGLFYVLNDSQLVRNGFEWQEDERYKVLEIQAGEYTVTEYFGKEPRSGDPLRPRGRANRVISDIPLVIVGAKDLHPVPEVPPLIGVSRASVAIYRLDADYRHQLFGSAQETLFISGVTEEAQIPTLVGAGVVHGLPQGAEAKYVGPSGRTIAAHRTAILDERQNAAQAGARLFDTEPTQRVSGEALKIRDAARNATLATIAMASGAGLEKVLRHVAAFLGEDPTKVIVKPNLEFVDRTLTPDQALNLVKGWQAQAFSRTTLYENLKKGGIASEERSVQEEVALIRKESSEEEDIKPQPVISTPPVVGAVP